MMSEISGKESVISTGIFVRRINGLRMGWRTLPGQCYRNPDIFRSVRKFFRLDDSTPVLWSGVGQAGPEGLNRLDPEGLNRPSLTCRTWISNTVRITEGDVVLLTRRFPGLMSNGWSPVTAALQLFAHLDGEALNVALLTPVKERERWKDLSNGLSEHYNSLGRLAVVRQWIRLRLPRSWGSLQSADLKTWVRAPVT